MKSAYKRLREDITSRVDEKKFKGKKQDYMRSLLKGEYYEQ